MITNSLTELLFTGSPSFDKFAFIAGLLNGARDIRFNFPELGKPPDPASILPLIDTENYLDLIFVIPNLELDGANFERVFVNVGKNNDSLEILLFFDLKDSQQKDYRASIEILQKWTEKIIAETGFEKVTCRLDNASEKDYYYFDQDGFRSLYWQL